MASFVHFLDTMSEAFLGSTGTGLDVLARTPKPEAIADELFRRDLVPATSAQIAGVYRELAGVEPTEQQRARTELVLMDFGFVAEMWA